MVTHVFVRRRKVLGKGAKVSRTVEKRKTVTKVVSKSSDNTFEY